MKHTNNYAAYPVLAYPCNEGCICALWLSAPCMPSSVLCHRFQTSATCTWTRIPCTSAHAAPGAEPPYRRAPCRPTGQAGSASWTPHTLSACSLRTYASPSPSLTLPTYQCAIAHISALSTILSTISRLSSLVSPSSMGS